MGLAKCSQIVSCTRDLHKMTIGSTNTLVDLLHQNSHQQLSNFMTRIHKIHNITCLILLYFRITWVGGEHNSDPQTLPYG